MLVRTKSDGSQVSFPLEAGPFGFAIVTLPESVRETEVPNAYINPPESVAKRPASQIMKRPAAAVAEQLQSVPKSSSSLSSAPASSSCGKPSCAPGYGAVRPSAAKPRSRSPLRERQAAECDKEAEDCEEECAEEEDPGSGDSTVDEPQAVAKRPAAKEQQPPSYHMQAKQYWCMYFKSGHSAALKEATVKGRQILSVSGARYRDHISRDEILGVIRQARNYLQKSGWCLIDTKLWARDVGLSPGNDIRGKLVNNLASKPLPTRDRPICETAAAPPLAQHPSQKKNTARGQGCNTALGRTTQQLAEKNQNTASGRIQNTHSSFKRAVGNTIAMHSCTPDF